MSAIGSPTYELSKYLANILSSTEEEAIRKTKRLAEALTANNDTANFIYNGRQRNRQQEVNGSDQRGMVVLPYA